MALIKFLIKNLSCASLGVDMRACVARLIRLNIKIVAEDFHELILCTSNISCDGKVVAEWQTGDVSSGSSIICPICSEKFVYERGHTCTRTGRLNVHIDYHSPFTATVS